MTTRRGSGRLSRAITRRPWRVVGAGAVLGVIAALVGGPVAAYLSPGGFNDPGSESEVAARQVVAATHSDPQQSVAALIRTGVPVRSASGAAEVASVRRRLEADPAMSTVFDPASTPALISRDGLSAYLVGELRPGSDRAAKEAALRLEGSLAGDPHVTLGGYIVANQQVQDQVAADLARAELLAALILTPLLIIVFRGVAALLPLMVGVLTILTTFLGLRLINSATDLSIFALNLVTGLGLGLAIDYTLLMVSRYREEAATRGYGAAAAQATLATAGRTVLFSSLTVAAAMMSLLLFPQQFLYSMGVGGLLVTLGGAAIALTVLPAVLCLLGPRIDLPRRLRGRTPPAGEGGWYRLSRAVMRHPRSIALATGAALLMLGSPFLGIRFTSVDAAVLPESASARQVDTAIRREFAVNLTTASTVTVAAPPSEATRVAAIAGSIRMLAHAALVSPPRYAGASTWVMTVVSDSGILSDRSQSLLAAIRALPAADGVRVTGPVARFVDLQQSLLHHMPAAVIVVVLVSVVVLFALTGSVILPIKSVLMNGLSLSAAFGLLVLIFQDGRLTSLLGYTGQGALESTQPILLFALVYGLSTDYGIFLLARIKEGHEAGLTTVEAVASGLERTGRIVTRAALLFCIAIGVFATSSLVFVKELGVGAAVAVIIDATIVRALLVPSLMALLGRLNWWAPRPLRRLHERVFRPTPAATPPNGC